MSGIGFLSTVLRRPLPSRLVREERGTSAVEFALILPVLIAIYLGGVEFSHTLTVNRKVTSAASAVGDLVAQGTILNEADIQNIFDAAQMILSPYDTTELKMVVSSIDVTDDGDSVIWSRAFHGSERPEGSAVTLPAGVRIEGTTLILAEAEYDYIPALGKIITDSIHLSDRFYLRPRAVDAVCLNDCDD
jgi:Flp pilus assembly pilin Flp